MTLQEWHFEVEFRGVPSDDEADALGELVNVATFVDDVVTLRFRAMADGFFAATAVLNRLVHTGLVADLMVSGVLSGPSRVRMRDEVSWVADEVAELGLPVGSSRAVLEAAAMAQVAKLPRV